MSRKLFPLFAGFLLVASCSPSPTPPSVQAPFIPLNVEACKSASLNLKLLSATTVRGLVTCLNGDNGALAPYKTFLDGMNDDDLNQLLVVYNQYIVNPSSRLNQAMDLIDRMHSQGILASSLKDLQVLTESNAAQKSLPVLSHFFEAEKGSSKSKPKPKPKPKPTQATGLNSFFVRLIDRNLVTPNLIGAANIAAGINARTLAVLMSLNTPVSVLNSGQAVDMISNELLSAIADNTVHEGLSHLSDTNISPINTLRLLSDLEVSNLSDFLSFLPQGSSTGGTRLQRLRLLVRGADAPVTCYKDGTQSRMVDNLLKMMGTEVLKRAPGVDTDAFFLQTIPLLVVTTQSACNYSNDILNNLNIDSEIPRLGYGNGQRSFFHLLLSGNRFEESASGLQSSHVPNIGPLMEELALRGAMPFVLGIAAKDGLPTDATSMSHVLDMLVDGTLQGQTLLTWITTNITSPSKEVLVADYNKLSSKKQNLLELSLMAEADTANDQALRDLKNAVAVAPISGADESLFTNAVSKIAASDPQTRQELKDFVSAFVVSLGDTRGGLGDLIATLAQASGLAPETPIQAILHDTLNDQVLVDALSPVLFKVTRDPNFANALGFTGVLAGNGNLEKLIEFFVELFKQSSAPGLTTASATAQYHKPGGDPFAVAHGAHPFQWNSVNSTYDVCLNLRGSIFDFNGENMGLALQCMNADGSYPALSKVAKQLSQSNEMPDAAAVFKNVVVSSPYLLGAIGELQSLFNTGELDKVFKLFALTGTSPYNIPYIVDPLLNNAFNHPGMSDALTMAGKISSLSSLTTAGQAAIDIIENPAQKIFISNNNYQLKISQAQETALKAQIKGLYKNWTSQQIDSAYAVAADNFINHNDTWRYVEGPYIQMTDAVWKQQILSFASDLLRTTDLPELVASLQDISKNMNLAAFLKRAINDRRVAIHYTDAGEQKLHILTLLDQLELLVEDTNFSVPLFGHVGVSFQLAVVKASNLSKAIKTQHTLSEVGKIFTEVIGQKRETNHFRSVLANFSGLQEVADTGELKIFQRIYTGFYNATPDQYKNHKSTLTNHMATSFYPNHVGMLANMTMALSNAEDQGQLETIVNSILGVTNLVQAQDLTPLKNTLTALVAQAQAGDTSALEVLLNKVLTIQQNPQGYQELKDTLFHLIPSVYRLQVEPTGALEAMPALLAQPLTWNDLLDKLVQDGSAPNGDLFTIGANLMATSEANVAAFQEVANIILANDPSTGTSLLPGTVAMLSDGYAARPADYSAVYNNFKAYQKDARVTALAPAALFRNILGELHGKSGVGDLTGSTLTDPNLRQSMIKLSATLTKNGEVGALSQIIVNLISNGKVDSALHFIFDNLVPTSVKSSQRRPQPVSNVSGTHN